ncbi:MAG TPA: hypothetical protein DD640_04350 [Clostridiales bacterium]|nr:hypothetical protein [Clostridiales bacterium]
MSILLVVLLFCALLLTITGSLQPWLGVLISLASLIALILLTYDRKQQQRQLLKRRRALRAVWGISVRHLGGLPLPLDTPGWLFLMAGQMQFESERNQLEIPLQNIKQILLTTAEQIRKIPDRMLCSFLPSISCHTFSALRDKIRRRDSMLRRNSILMLVYGYPDGEASLLILAAVCRPNQLDMLLRHSSLAGQVQVRRRLGPKDIPVV